MIKVYFKEFWCCKSNFCNCDVEDFYTFSHIQGVNSKQYQACEYEMIYGNKSCEWECLTSVFWALAADKRQYDNFYDMCENFEDIDEDSIIEMLSDKGIEVVFISEEESYETLKQAIIDVESCNE